MIYVDIVYKAVFTGKWTRNTKEFTNKWAALRGMFAMRDKGLIIEGWRCDDPLDNEWLSYRFKLQERGKL